MTVVMRTKGADGVVTDIKKVASSADEASGAFTKMGTIAGGILAADAFKSGFSNLSASMGSFVSDASNLNESMNAVNKVFGDASPKVVAFGNDAATAAGLSAEAFNQLATPLGAMLQNAGFGADAAADSTIALTQRAADMASVFNTDVSQALAAIQAGLRGEADPLEQFGVGLSAAAVEAKALAMTGKTVAKELTDQEKATARIALIMQQTEKIAGDFADTQGGLANASRILNAEQANFRAEWGGKLVPVMEKGLATFMKLPGPLRDIGFGIMELGPGASQVAMGLGAMMPLLTNLGPAFQGAAMGARALGLAMLTPPVGIIVALAAAGVAAYVFRDEIADAFGWIADKVVPVVEGVGEDVVGAFDKVLDFGKEHWPEIATLISGPFAPIVLLATDAFGVRSAFSGALTKMGERLGGWGQSITQWFRDIPGDFKDGFGDGFSFLWDAFKGAINKVIGGWNGLSFSLPEVDTNIPGVGKIGGWTLHTPDIPMLAQGGIVTRPTLAMIGEAGPEAVVPLNRAGSMGGWNGGAAQELHVHFHIAGSILSTEREITAIVARAARAGGFRGILQPA